MNLNATTGFDLMAMKMTTTQLSATYDLHCFTISVSWFLPDSGSLGVSGLRPMLLHFQTFSSSRRVQVTGTDSDRLKIFLRNGKKQVQNLIFAVFYVHLHHPTRKYGFLLFPYSI